MAEEDERAQRGEDARGGMRQKGRKGERDGGRTDGEADTINFVPISELGFVPSEASLSPPRQGRTSNLLQLFRQYSFAALHWVFHALVRHSRVPTTKRRELQSAKWFIGAGRAGRRSRARRMDSTWGKTSWRNKDLPQSDIGTYSSQTLVAGAGAGGGPRVLPTYPPSYS